MGIFKANDIRGIYPDELSPDIVYKIGYLLPDILKTNRILIGMDGRNSSPEIFTDLSRGITDAGADVCNIGLCDTPAVYFSTVQYNFSGSIMITASHNPPEFNGLKISGKGAVPLGPESGLLKLRDRLGEDVFPKENRGQIEELDIIEDYRAHVCQFLTGGEKLKVVMDCGNGAASRFAEDIFASILPELSIILDEADGNFPVHGPNPLEEESWSLIQGEIKESASDIGILFDGDGDRAIFFDENGTFISPDVITALIGNYFYKDKSEQGAMFYDIRSSRSVAEYVEGLGGAASACVTGHARIKKLLKDEAGVYAGELSGHYYFRDNFNCDSGFIAAAVVLSVLSGLQTPMSRIVDSINPYCFSGEINFNVTNQKSVLDEMVKLYPDGELSVLDGIKIEYPSWWFNLRPSGAESLLRLVVEAGNVNDMNEKVSMITNEILKFDGKYLKGERI